MVNRTRFRRQRRLQSALPKSRIFSVNECGPKQIPWYRPTRTHDHLPIVGIQHPSIEHLRGCVNLRLVHRVPRMAHHNNGVFRRNLNHRSRPVVCKLQLFSTRLVGEGMGVYKPPANRIGSRSSVRRFEGTNLHKHVLLGEKDIHVRRSGKLHRRIRNKCLDSRGDARGRIVIIVVPKHDILGSSLSNLCETDVAQTAHTMTSCHFSIANIRKLASHGPIVRRIVGVVYDNPEVGFLKLCHHTCLGKLPAPTSIPRWRTHHDHW